MLALDTLTLKTYLLFEDARGCQLQLVSGCRCHELTSLSWDGIATGIELFGEEVSANTGSALRAGASSRGVARKCLPASRRNILRLRPRGKILREIGKIAARRAVACAVACVALLRGVTSAASTHTRPRRGKSPFLARGQKIRGERKKTVRVRERSASFVSIPPDDFLVNYPAAHMENPALFSTRSNAIRKVSLCCWTKSKNCETVWIRR